MGTVKVLSVLGICPYQQWFCFFQIFGGLNNRLQISGTIMTDSTHIPSETLFKDYAIGTKPLALLFQHMLIIKNDTIM